MKLLDATFDPFDPSPHGGKPIIVLMSGGVDSSVAAMLLRDSGRQVVGVTMKIPTARDCDYSRSCCGMEAGYVCRELRIPHYYLDVGGEFDDLVIKPFARDYRQGRTPSPCVDCNSEVKFGVAWEFLRGAFGIDDLATGHYARIGDEQGRACLCRGRDHTRDQSYFLYGIRAEKLSSLLFPLVDYSKDQVRQMAACARLPVARRSDSMELCFAGEGDYRKALGLESRAGEIYDTAGRVIGQHQGIENFTIGQRKGIGIAAREPLYVVRISPEQNSITVGTADDAMSTDVVACHVNVLIPDLLVSGTHLYGKIRSQGEPAQCEIQNFHGRELSVRFSEPQFAPTPGQRLVLYSDRECVVAGGVISPGSAPGSAV